MSNLFLDAEAWQDGIGSPPIWWNPVDGRYEILIQNEGSASGSFSIQTSDVAQSGDSIAFSYDVSGFDPEVGRTTGFLNIRRDSTVVHSIDFIENPSGTVDIECEPGGYYGVFVAYASDTYYSQNFYDFIATLTPTPDPPPPVIPGCDCVSGGGFEPTPGYGG